ncbi:MAG: DegV family protein [Lachnospiraceae bacterium]|nr:DegV family protein [Lachnospiraceae bacterium]
MALRIITDSTADISQAEAKELGLTVVPLNVLANGKTYEDGVTLSTEEFYQILETSEALPSTSQPSPEAFLKYFKEIKEAGDEAVVILIGTCISGTVQSANLAKNMVEYDKIYIIDSDTAACGLNLLVREALKLANKGMDGEAVAKEITALKERVRLVVLLDTLDYLIKGGRISKTAGAVGSLIKLKPVITLTKDGISMLDKARGTKGGFKSLKNNINDQKWDVSYPVYFGYAKDEQLTKDFFEMAKTEWEISESWFGPTGCVIGTHTGPGAVIIAYVKEV